MEPAKSNPVEAPPGPAAEIFAAVITPHRSLSRRGFVLVMLALAGLSFAAGTVFLLMGAWPIFGFLGLDVALVWWAFRANYRAARAQEIIRLRQSELLVRRVGADGVAAEWRFNPYWVRIAASRDSDGVIEALALTSHGRRLEIAKWLSAPEKAEFLQAFGAALAAARRVPSG